MNTIVISNNRNTTYCTIKFPNEELKYKFLRKIYLNNSEITVDAEQEQLEEIVQRVLYVNLHNTYISLGVSKRTLNEILKTHRDTEELRGAVELVVELDNLPLVYKQDDCAKLYNLKVSPKNVLFIDKNSIDEEDIEEMKRLAFATKLERTAREMFED